MTLYRSRYQVSMDRPPIEDGGLLVEGNIIAVVGNYRDLAARYSAPTVDLGDVIIMPGLINAHCHLELSSLRGLVTPQPTFSKWIQRINSTKRTLTDDDYLTATIRGTHELIRRGTTSVVSIESIPEILDRRPSLPIRMWWCYEMIDIRRRQNSDASMRGALSVFESSENELTNFALSPHSPYTASAALFCLAERAARHCNLLLTTHVAESAEEMQMFRDAGGPLYDFLAGLGRDMSDCGTTTPLQHLIEKGHLTPESLLVHLNELSPNDYALLARWANGEPIHVVHCPKSHQFFGHSPFPYQQLLKANANVSLGTDSLASNDRLDLFAEMQCFAREHPDVSPVEIIEMVTRNPALSLRQPDHLGLLRAAAQADVIAIPVENIHLPDVHEAILHNTKAINWVMVAGQLLTL